MRVWWLAALVCVLCVPVWASLASFEEIRAMGKVLGSSLHHLAESVSPLAVTLPVFAGIKVLGLLKRRLVASVRKVLRRSPSTKHPEPRRHGPPAAAGDSGDYYYYDDEDGGHNDDQLLPAGEKLIRGNKALDDLMKAAAQESIVLNPDQLYMPRAGPFPSPLGASSTGETRTSERAWRPQPVSVLTYTPALITGVGPRPFIQQMPTKIDIYPQNPQQQQLQQQQLQQFQQHQQQQLQQYHQQQQQQLQEYHQFQQYLHQYQQLQEHLRQYQQLQQQQYLQHLLQQTKTADQAGYQNEPKLRRSKRPVGVPKFYTMIAKKDNTDSVSTETTNQHPPPANASGAGCHDLGSQHQPQSSASARRSRSVLYEARTRRSLADVRGQQPSSALSAHDVSRDTAGSLFNTSAGGLSDTVIDNLPNVTGNFPIVVNGFHNAVASGLAKVTGNPLKAASNSLPDSAASNLPSVTASSLPGTTVSNLSATSSLANLVASSIFKATVRSFLDSAGDSLNATANNFSDAAINGLPNAGNSSSNASASSLLDAEATRNNLPAAANSPSDPASSLPDVAGDLPDGTAGSLHDATAPENAKIENQIEDCLKLTMCEANVGWWPSDDASSKRNASTLASHLRAFVDDDEAAKYAGPSAFWYGYYEAGVFGRETNSTAACRSRFAGCPPAMEAVVHNTETVFDAVQATLVTAPPDA